MIRGILVLSCFVSTILFPWPLTLVLVGVTAFFEPLIPGAIGLFADTLYFVPSTHALPLATFGGILLSVMMVYVHDRLRTSTMRG